MIFSLWKNGAKPIQKRRRRACRFSAQTRYFANQRRSPARATTANLNRRIWQKPFKTEMEGQK